MPLLRLAGGTEYDRNLRVRILAPNPLAAAPGLTLDDIRSFVAAVTLAVLTTRRGRGAGRARE